MHTGAIPHTSVYGTWSEAIEVRSSDDEGLVDLSAASEITLRLVEPFTKFEELVINMSGGQITLPSLGIIQWRVESMRNIFPRAYEMVLTIEINGDTIPLILGSLSVME